MHIAKDIKDLATESGFFKLILICDCLLFELQSSLPKLNKNIFFIYVFLGYHLNEVKKKLFGEKYSDILREIKLPCPTEILEFLSINKIEMTEDSYRAIIEELKSLLQYEYRSISINE